MDLNTTAMAAETTQDGLISEARNQNTIGGPGDGLSLADQTQGALQKEFPMASGDGEASYSKNSEIQAILVNEVPQLSLNEALERVTLPSKGAPMIVADLGSSSSPNSVNNVVLIVNKLRHRLPKDTEFQAYFNDLSSNDFNTLFLHISNDPRAKNLFASGVPGSFHARLFPKSSVHVFYSANCLHWLSENSSDDGRGTPKIKQSAAGRCVPATFKSQAALDLRNFFLARAAELVSGGLLFTVLGGRSAPEPNNPMDNVVDLFSADLDEIWSDLIAEGLVTEQQRDTFNIPIYHRGVEDLREAIASCASLFSVLTVKLHRVELSGVELFATSNSSEVSKKMVGMHKAVLNNVFEAFLGKELTQVIWQRYEKLVEKKIVRGPEDLKIGSSVWIVSLIRK